jgi:hypothetical protein
MVLFCLLLLKMVAWLPFWLLKGLVSPSRGLWQALKRNSEGAHWLVEAFSLLRDTMDELELTWRHLFHPIDCTEDTPSLEYSTQSLVKEHVQFPPADVSVVKCFEHGWRMRRMIRRVTTKVNMKLSQVEDEAQLLAYVTKRASTDSQVEDSRTPPVHEELVRHFLRSFNPALNGIRMLGAERLVEHHI